MHPHTIRFVAAEGWFTGWCAIDPTTKDPV